MLACVKVKGHEQIVELLLLVDSDFDINHRNNYGNNPLHLACANGHQRIVSILIANHINVNQKTILC